MWEFKCTEIKCNKKLLMKFADEGMWILCYSHKSRKCFIKNMKNNVIYKTNIILPGKKEMTLTWAVATKSTPWMGSRRFLMPWSYNKLIFDKKEDAVAARKKINMLWKKDDPEDMSVFGEFHKISVETNDQYMDFTEYIKEKERTWMEKHKEDEHSVSPEVTEFL